MKTHEITFDERTESQPIAFTGPIDDVTEGCEVGLEHDGVSISAKVVKNEGGEWLGKITNIPSSDAENTGNLKIGATVRFQDCHIFRCAA